MYIFGAPSLILTLRLPMNYKLFPVLLFGLLSFTTPRNTTTDPKIIASTAKITLETRALNLYHSLNANSFKLPQLQSFTKAFEGFFRLQQMGKIENNILTLVDFSLSANTKRLWVIDMDSQTILYHSLVAHGRNSGEEYATQFSNKPESFQSSLGFYITGETYQGKHGYSLRLDGVEPGINDKARERAVVIHGADYVSEEFIRQNKRLGRSQGCPALPKGISEEIIQLIQNKSCLFIYHPSRNYQIASKLVS